MARWQLTEPHYLNVPGNKWEMEIKNRTNGRSERKQFLVPMHLDPNIEGDWNYQDRLGNNIVDGKIIVCWEGKGEDADIVFAGPPTPGMLPLDDEARAETAKYSWTPTAGLDEQSQANSFSQQLLIQFTEELKGVAGDTQNVNAGMAEFMKTMAAMMQQQTAILAQLAAARDGEVIISPVDPTAPVETQDEALARIAAEEGLEPIVDTLPPLPAASRRVRKV
jgi:hypothetical protein